MFKNKLKQMGVICAYNFRLWHKNTRIIMTFCLAFIVSFLLSERALNFSQQYDSSMQAFEPFIWTFGDGTSIMIASSLLLLLFSDMPLIHAGTPTFLIRTTRKCWIAGQVLYILLATAIFTAFIFVATTLLCMKNIFSGNMWSQTAAMLGYSGAGDKFSLPSSVKVMERISPYTCSAQIAVLLLLYCLSMVMLMLFINLKWSRKAGMVFGVLYGLLGLLLNPEILKGLFGEEFPVWRINVLLGWISPLNHATYSMHNFGYDRLPTIDQSMIGFLVLIAVAFFGVTRQMRRYSFHFTGK